MIGSIALGLVVDDTVHFMVRLRRNISKYDMETAVKNSMEETGRPIILTTLILTAGFFTLGFGSFLPNIAFGIISGVVILCAVIADLVLLPAILLTLKPRL